MSTTVIDHAEVVVVGSGAGGGLIAAELGQRGLDVLLLEAGQLQTADMHSRFELRSRRRLWWPVETVETDDDIGPMALLRGRSVGGTTTVNTKVAMRAAASDVAKFHPRTGLTGDGGEPFASGDLEPWYDLVEERLGVRERSDWKRSVHLVDRGFREMGTELEPVRSYTDQACTSLGACLDGCPTDGGKSSLNVFLAPALRDGRVRLRTETQVTRVLVDGQRTTPQVEGVECVARNTAGVVEAPIVVLAGGALSTPRILLRSQRYMALASPSTAVVGRTLGLHPVRLVYGLFDEPLDCHMAYPITAHCLAHQADEAGGFVLEATTIQEPVAFAQSLVDDRGRPLWGRDLVEIVERYRYWAGILVMATDDNTASVEVDDRGASRFRKHFTITERQRIDGGLAFAQDVLRAAGATRVVHTGLFSTHAQGSAPMGEDPARSVVDGSGRSHDVAGLYVGDGSLVPASLSVNPSLTIMALAARVAQRMTQEVSA